MNSYRMNQAIQREQAFEAELAFNAKVAELTKPMWSQYNELNWASKRRKVEYVNTYKHAWLRGKMNGLPKDVVDVLKAAYKEVERALL